MSTQHSQKHPQIDSAESADYVESAADALNPVAHQTQLLFDEFPDGIALFSRNGKMSLRNRAFQRLISGDRSASMPDGNAQQTALYLRDMLVTEKQQDILLELLQKNRVIPSYPLTFKASNESKIDTEVSVVADLKADCFVLHVKKVRDTAYGEEESLHMSKLLQALMSQPKGKSLLERVSATTEVLERYYIERALSSVKGNRAAAARKLGLSRQSLYVKLNRYGIGEQTS